MVKMTFFIAPPQMGLVGFVRTVAQLSMKRHLRYLEQARDVLPLQ